MANIDDYNAHLVDLKAIPKEEVREPNMPVDNAIQEAENLHHWSKEDLALLQAAGLDISLIEALPKRAGILRHAQSLWMKDYGNREAVEKQWKEESPLAYELHGELMHYFRYAYRDDEALMIRVNRIAEGGGHADLIQDFSDMVILGREHPDPLLNVGFNMAKLDKADGYANSLAGLLAKVNGARTNNSEAKEMRDRAFTYLKQAVDVIRDCGKFVFWKDEEKAERYGSGYFRNLRADKKRKQETVQ